jgi:hypothetical protein
MKQTVPITGSRLGAADWVIRGATAGAVLVVAGIAAVISFTHIEHLALTHGQTRLASVLLPLSIDGAVAASSLVMLRAARAGLGTPWLARTMLGLSVAATLACNVAFGLPFGLAGALLSGWPAAAFVGCAEMSLGMVRRTVRAVPVPVPGVPVDLLPRVHRGALLNFPEPEPLNEAGARSYTGRSLASRSRRRHRSQTGNPARSSG